MPYPPLFISVFFGTSLTSVNIDESNNMMSGNKTCRDVASQAKHASTHQPNGFSIIGTFTTTLHAAAHGMPR